MFLSWLNNPENYIPATEATKLRRFSPSKIIIFVLKWMGGYITMGIIVLLLLMKRLIKKEYNLLAYYPFSQLLIIFIISFVWTMLLTFVLPTGADMFRGIRYAILSLELVFGYIFYENIHSQSKQKANTYKWIFTGIISVIIILHISNSLPSPFIEAPNGELTPMEVIGTKWVLEKGERNGIFGISTTTINGIFASILGASAELPKVTYVGDHFENLFNKKTPSRSYIWVSQVDKSMYLELWNETQRFTLIDFVKIYESKEINLVYCNEELSIHNMEGLQ
ncbi:Hypothetical protein TES1_2031 [Thermococcus paralvinellae]|uniref:Uncharacterized protein n=2 Tax=Thermococcus paralvinellae TaxID=582419 RepID=W0I5L5_9EURY|nr:Hypothetical protein TES1_2031 [Thermococcus paralvinellae]